jgi:hypothetical protein
MMMIKRYYRDIAVLLSLTALVAVVVVSCGGGGDNGGGGTTLTDTQKAAASAIGAQSASSLSMNVGSAAGDAQGFLPPSVKTAPGKTSPRTGTAAIANIDPRLKDMVDKMRAQMQRPMIAGALSKTSARKAMSAATVSAASTLCTSGTYTVADTIATSPSGTTHAFSVTYNSCRDSSSSIYEILSGSITGTYSNNADSSHAAQLHVDLSTSTYDSTLTSPLIATLTMSGDFTSQVNGTLTAGGNTANGSFVERLYFGGADISSSLLFSNVSDSWTYSTSGGNVTDEHTGNGGFTLQVQDNTTGSRFGLTVTLTNLVDKFITYANYDTDEWINGRVGISWTPDLSQWGCLQGNYDFTTLAPVHTAVTDYCPSSGSVRVNNAVIQFGVPTGTNVKVTLDGGPSEVFTDCTYLGGGMCSSGGTAGSPTAGGTTSPVPPPAAARVM